MATSITVSEVVTINTECPICIEPINEDMLIFQCKHGFHDTCAMSFLKASFTKGISISCPFCRNVELDCETADYWDTFEGIFPEEHCQYMKDLQTTQQAQTVPYNEIRVRVLFLLFSFIVTLLTVIGTLSYIYVTTKNG
jgi:hypothetical protein